MRSQKTDKTAKAPKPGITKSAIRAAKLPKWLYYVLKEQQLQLQRVSDSHHNRKRVCAAETITDVEELFMYFAPIEYLTELHRLFTLICVQGLETGEDKLQLSDRLYKITLLTNLLTTYHLKAA